MFKSRFWSSVGRFVSVGALLFSVALTSACLVGGVTGTGPVTSEPRPVGAFTRVEASQGVDVEIQIGPTQQVAVRAQSNILPLVTTTADAGTLRVGVSGPVALATEMAVTVVMPSLDAVVLSGGTTVIVTGLAGAAFEATLSGGSVLDADGAIDTATVSTSGGSRAQLRELAVTTMLVDTSGGSVVEATVSAEVRGSASGGSRVSVAGGAVLNVESSGGANVERI